MQWWQLLNDLLTLAGRVRRLETLAESTVTRDELDAKLAAQPNVSRTGKSSGR